MTIYVPLADLPGRAPIEVAFAVVADLGPQEQRELSIDGWVPPGSLPARYQLAARVDPDDLVIESNEDDNFAVGNEVWVSTLRVKPGQLDFGVVGTGCSATKTVRLTQTGQTPAFVGSAMLAAAHPDFSLQSVALPRRLDPGEGLRLDVVYSPVVEATNAQAVLTVSHDQSLDPFEIPIGASSQLRPERLQEFTQLDAARIDVLFVVDDSSSMSQERERLAAHAPDFVEQLEADGVDYHIGVTTTDVSPGGPRGAFVVPFISRDTPNAAIRFAEAVQVGLSGATSEQGLEAALLALSEPNLSGPNDGFLRRDASLALVFVSDEDDASPEPVDTYASFFFRLKRPGGDHRVVANAIVGPLGGCPDAIAGARYIDLAVRTQGVVESVCAFSWPTALRNFPGRGFGFLNQFLLEHEPLPSTIEVWVDGQALPERELGRTNWWFESSPAPTLVFDGLAVPEPGTRIELRYRSAC